jgi:hypothetical protein
LKLAFYAFLHDFEKAGGLGPIGRQARSAIFPWFFGVLGRSNSKQGIFPYLAQKGSWMGEWGRSHC